MGTAEFVDTLRSDGFVRLQDVVSRQSVETLNAKMQADLDTVAPDRSSNPWISLRPPPFAPYLFREIVYNEHAIDVIRAVLGDEATLTTYGANTSWPEQKEPQRVHRDVPDAPHGESSPGVVINVPLTTFTSENGATLIYPGSHLGMLEEAPNPPVQTAGAQPGDLLIRDLRLWHAGMPNLTDERRIMLALVVIDAAYRGPDESGFKGFEAEEGSEEFWHHPRLKTAVSFVPAGDRSYYMQGKHSQPLTALRRDWVARGH